MEAGAGCLSLHGRLSSKSPKHRETLFSAELTYFAAFYLDFEELDFDHNCVFLRMKMSKNKRRQQQQGGRPVLVTLYVAAQPTDRGDSTASSSYHHHYHKEHHQDHHHHHSHGGGRRPDMLWRRRRNDDGKSQSSNRRADLLEYSRQLRASARQTAATTTTATVSSTPAPRAPPPRWDTNTSTSVGVRRDERPRQQVVAVNRLERTMSPQKIRQRCFGVDDWSWKRVLLLVFPFHSKSRRPRRSNRDDSEMKVNINQTGRPAASLLVGKLTVSKDRRDRSGFLKTLMPSFQKRSR